ncbi:MAG: hypothetical protein R2749_23060 [Acidimicrobiales bacterium]
MSKQSLARQIAALVNPIHNVSYYTPEIRVFNDELGIKGWWTAYFAYRSAPMGQVEAEVMAATFYGFAPRMIRRGVPAVWERVTPRQALDVRLDAVDRAWRRIFASAPPTASAGIVEAAGLLRRSIEGVDGGARPLYAGHTTLAWPAEDQPHLVLWHACTLLREHRGDSHTIALAAAEVDPVQCQVLMAARGHGNKATLQKIRGWDDEEWDGAVRALHLRGWVHADGTMTPQGRQGRRDIEEHTDALAAEPARRLGVAGVQRLDALLAPVHEVLLGPGAIPGVWPPAHVVEGKEPSDR